MKFNQKLKIKTLMDALRNVLNAPIEENKQNLVLPENIDFNLNQLHLDLED